MFGFRLLAVILGLLCLTAALSMAFFESPRMAQGSEFFVRYFVPDTEVEAFIKSEDPGEIKIKHLIKYTLTGLAVSALATGLLFFAAAANPLRMRPFIVVVMISTVVGIAAVIWQGFRLDIFNSWWIRDASGGLLLLILLAALFPREKTVATKPAVVGNESYEE